MLNERMIATILAALQFWQEEMCPHGPTAMQPYLPPGQPTPLVTAEIDQLREALANWDAGTTKFVLCDPSGTVLRDIRIFPTALQAAEEARTTDAVIAVLLLS